MRHLIFIALFAICGAGQAADLVKGNTYRLMVNLSQIERALDSADETRTAFEDSTFEVLDIINDKGYLVKFTDVKLPSPDQDSPSVKPVSEDELYWLKKEITGSAVASSSLSNYLDGDFSGQLEVYAYIGTVFDNFASDNLNDYLNQNDSGDTKSRETFGVWFQYPLVGDSLWIFGLTAHGVRSSDIDCKSNPDLSVCEPFAGPIADPNERALYMLRNSSSLEAMLGLRYEFSELHGGNSTVYAAYQLGFVAVDDDDGDAAEITRLSLGARIARGKYRNSFIEIAPAGENELFIEGKTGRLQINARLTREFPITDDYSVPGFIHLSGDFDDGDGADAIQTYVGVALKFN